MQETEYLIIGQGISGTWLSYYLRQEQKSFLVIDNNDPFSPSRIAAGIINPVTGRRHVTVWMAEEILPFAWEAYTKLGTELGISAISHKNIIDFFPSPQMRESFTGRVEEKGPWLYTYPEQNHFNHLFNYDFGCGEIRPVYVVHLETLLPQWREHLLSRQQLREENFDILQVRSKGEKVLYKDIVADKIIFCDGAAGSQNPYFRLLPFAPNKGEALIVNIPGLPDHNIYKKGMMLAPLSKPGEWWIGSNYEWEFDDPRPSPGFRQHTEFLLNEWLKIPFRIETHLAGIRPATLERRPFIGMHPQHPQIGIFNGMGTKGCSLAPFFAKELADHLIYNQPITIDADVKRFGRILSR
jgi:glycine/D-amino acid oxidase-like deaminating enzyme